MLKDSTRKALGVDILLSLRGSDAVKTVKAAREIFHAEWTDEDIDLMCSHIRKHGASDWASARWENDVDQIYRQLLLLTSKATDFQMSLWLEKTWGDGLKALKYILACEQTFN